MPPRPKELHAGRKVFFVVMLAAVCGFLWAMVDKKVSPSDLMKIFGTEEKKGETPPADTSKKTESTQPPPRKEEKKETPVKKEEKKETGPKIYSEAEMTGLFNAVSESLRDARYPEAREKLASVNKMMIPTPQIPQFTDLQEKVATLCKLIVETTRGGRIEMPPLTRIHLKNGNQIVAKSPTSDATRWYFEEIRGFRSSIPRDEVDRLEKLTSEQGFAAVWVELQRQCGYKGVAAEMDIVNSRLKFTFKDAPNRKTTGLQFFDLADFAAKNGANKTVTPLFEEALKRDPNLVQTVHEVKGERMVDVFIYFLSINSKADAEFTLSQILKPRYSDTRAYVEKVLKDKDTRDAIAIVTKKEVKESDLVKPGGNGGNDAPPPVDERPVPVPDTKAPVAGEFTTKLPGDAPAKARELCAQGDKLFEEGHNHLMKSDPVANPESWAAENKKALKCFADAFDKYYYPAQEEFEKAGMKSPTELNEKANETQMRRAMCRKRSVSSK